ncbi:MAG: hypothetical protein ACI3W5_13725 [Faecousia sp.]
MDVSKIIKKFTNLAVKYKYAILILLVGIVLMALPQKSTQKEQTQPSVTVQQEQITVEQQLANILSNVKGAGRVEVMLTIKEGEEILYQTNTDTSQSDTTGSVSSDTVILSDKDRTQSGLVRKVNGPKYQGAIILCTGANDPSVRLAIIDAVSKITGLGADKISVLEIK